MNRQSLESLLQQHQIPFHSWGQGESKTIKHLLDEITEGESVLEVRKGQLIKKVQGVGIDIFFHANGLAYKLVESRQIFAGGRVRTRNLSTSLGEKMKPEETPHFTARRALKEELGFDNVESLVPDGMEYSTDVRPPTVSDSFPGLVTQRTIYTFTIDLPIKCYDENGYTETQPDKTTYFVWTPVNS